MEDNNNKILPNNKDVNFDELINEYLPLVNKIARKYFLVGAGTDDLIQEGMIGLYKAIKNFDSQKQNSFKSFANLCIERQLITAIKTSNRNKNIPLNAYLSINNQGMVVIKESDENDEEGIYLPANSLSPEENVLSKEKRAMMDKQISQVLSDYEKKVLKYYIEGKNYMQIAGILNKEPKSIDNALTRIKIKLSFLLEQND